MIQPDKSPQADQQARTLTSQAGENQPIAESLAAYSLVATDGGSSSLSVIESSIARGQLAISRARIGGKDRKALQNYLSERSTTEERALDALSVVEKISSLSIQIRRFTAEGTLNPSIVSTKAMIEVADNLNLQGSELKELVEVATTYRRSFRRVAEIACSIAGSRTALEPEDAFRNLQPEQRGPVLEATRQLYQGILLLKDQVNEPLSISTVERIFHSLGSVSAVQALLLELSESGEESFRFKKFHSPYGVYNTILFAIAEQMKDHPTELFSLHEFLSKINRVDVFQRYSDNFEDDDRYSINDIE